MAGFDLLLVADPRLAGAEARALALLVDALARRDHQVGLLPVRSLLPKPVRPFDPALASRLRDDRLILVDSDRLVECRILLIWHIAPLCERLDRPPQIRAGHAILRFDQVPWREDCPDQALMTRIRRQFARLASGASIEEVAADGGIATLLGLGDEVWLPPARPSRCPGMDKSGAEATIGRHGGLGNAVWPMDASGFARAYPARPGLQIDLRAPPLGLLRRRIEKPSPYLRLLPAGCETLVAFLARLDAWHLATWPGRPQPAGAELVEAAAQGTPLSLPREVAGWPVDAASFHRGEFRELPADRMPKARRALEFLRGAADPEALADRLEKRGLARCRTVPVLPPAVHRPARTVLMVSPNGVGMGHLTRLLAVARRLPAKVEPVFLTMSQAVAVIGQYGFHGEYMPYHSYYGGDADYWNHGLLARLQAMVGFYDPRAILFDGNMPYAALADLRQLCPERRFIWLRRGLWRPEAGKVAIERSALFDMVVEPGEFAADVDRGFTRTRRGEVIQVPPVTLLDPDEILAREAARAELAIPPDATAVAILLGSQNNFDYGEIRRTIAARFSGRPDVVLIEAEWLISENKGSSLLPGARSLSGYPLARLFRAFDFAISAAGYNSFHELLSIGMPAIFVPNENPSMDEQEARAAWAEREGLGVVVRTHQQDRLAWALEALQEPQVATRMRQNAQALPPTNGGAIIAQLIEEQVVTRDAITRQAGLPHMAPHSAPLLA